MRKADYSLLADILRTEQEFARHWLETAEQNLDPFARQPETEKTIAHSRVTIRACRRIAEKFASSANVDRAAFLQACGIQGESK